MRLMIMFISPLTPLLLAIFPHAPATVTLLATLLHKDTMEMEKAEKKTTPTALAIAQVIRYWKWNTLA